MSFVFAGLPFMKNLWRIAGKPSKELTDSIAKLLVGKSLKTADEVNALMRVMTPEQLKVWEKIAYLPQSEITPELQALIKSREDAIKLIKTSKERFIKGAINVSKEMGKDLVTATAIAHSFEKIKSILKIAGYDVKTQEELDQIKAWLNKHPTELEQARIQFYLLQFLQENPSELNKIKKSGLDFNSLGNKTLKFAVRKDYEQQVKSGKVSTEMPDSLKQYLNY